MEKIKNILNHHFILLLTGILLVIIVLQPTQKIISPLAASMLPLHSLSESETRKTNHEIFGFLPHWTMDNANSIDFATLTTLAYFDVKVNADGNLLTDDVGYQSFISRKATQLFTKAHANGTRVVLTLTQMDPNDIEMFLVDEEAQKRTIQQTVSLVERRGIDGINVDFEYGTDAGYQNRAIFTKFVKDLTTEMHNRVPNSKVTVSVYASAVKEPKLYDISSLAQATDGIFMMAYDFATTSSDIAMPTAPLKGYKENKYWYDVSTAVEDFLTQMPANKLILGTPLYGLNFSVYEPGFKAETIPWWYWGSSSILQTYESVRENVTPTREDVVDMKKGWDDVGQVGYISYYNANLGSWRMVYIDDVRSLGLKYDFAKDKQLLGVGLWAIGFEGENPEIWSLLKDKFGEKIADIRILKKQIHDNI